MQRHIASVHQGVDKVIHCGGRAQVGHQRGVLRIQQVEYRHRAARVGVAHNGEITLGGVGRLAR